MSNEQAYLAAAYDGVTSRTVEKIAALKPGIGDWVYVDDFPAYNSFTGKPAKSEAGTLRQVFTVTEVNGAGDVTEVHPKVLNYPHRPFIIVTITPQSKVRCYDPRLAFIQE